jgi:hypothetical protein
MNQQKPHPHQQQINIKLDEKVGEGVYSNFFMITNNQSEYIVDFGRIVPGVPDVKVYTRVMTTPQHAKQLYMLLKQNIDQYEKQFGEIKMPPNMQPENKNIGFTNNEDTKK